MLDCSFEYYQRYVLLSLCIDSRNRCIPLVDTVSQSSKRCVVPDSPADPTAPNYVDPESPACLAQTVEETVTHTKASQTDVLTNSLLSIQVFLQRYMSDISASSFVLVIGGVTSFVLGFVFLVRSSFGY